MKFKKVFSLLLCAALLFSVLGYNSTAESDAVTEISTYAEFLKIADNLSSSYRLTKDITVPEGSLLTPFGSASSPFCGVLDGNGYTIRNLTLATERENSVSLGIFAYNNGTVKNLAVDNIQNESIKSCKYLYAGAVSGINLSNSIIKNCIVRGKLSIKTDDVSYVYIGGITGRNSGQLIESVSSYVDVSVDTDASVTAGGLTSETLRGTVWRSECYGKLNIRADGDCFVGGITAKLSNKNTRLQDNLSATHITTSFNKTNENIYVGGIVASTENDAEVTVYMNIFSGTFSIKPPESMITSTRKYLYSPIAASGRYNGGAKDNYYINKCDTIQSNAQNITATLSTVTEIRNVFAERNGYWTITENTTDIPVFSKIGLCDIDFARNLDNQYNGVRLNAPIFTEIKNRAGLSLKEEFKAERKYITDGKLTLNTFGTTVTADICLYTPCDINGDDLVTASDVVALRDIILNERDLSAQTLLSAENDNRDGLTATDIVCVIDAILKK